MEDKELELQRWQDIILNHLDSQRELDELTDFMDSNVILIEEQMNMLKRMIYPLEENLYKLLLIMGIMVKGIKKC